MTPRRPVLKLSGSGRSRSRRRTGCAPSTRDGCSGGDTPDGAKAIRLESAFATDKGTAEHMLIDLTPGHGKFEGKAVLTLHFGSLFPMGVLA